MLDNEGTQARHRDARHAVRDADDRPAAAGWPTRSRASSSGRWAAAPAAAPRGTRRAAGSRAPRRDARRPRAPRSPQAAQRASSLQHSRGGAQAAEARHRHPGRLHGRRRRRTRSGWGRREIRDADGSNAFNLFGIKAGAGWKGPVAEVTTTEYVDGEPRKVTAKFRAYASYDESFADYAQLMKDSPRYRASSPTARARAQRLRARPAARRLRHRPGLRRQAGARHQHHAAPAARHRPERESRTTHEPSRRMLASARAR